MITLMVAKWTGDLFNEGIYDKHITIKGVPFLEWDAPTFSQKLQAKDIMDVNLLYVYPHSKVNKEMSGLLIYSTVYPHSKVNYLLKTS